ncbi:hypothetical protein QR98_0049150 [Sarcoptes scabiei]|uniref:Uncharacterized protein n=1 Tax=Sarcoptes scabiei TaxID=52283 RepID=A0A132A6B5_SARSC|nr:hypothetical protein QR98_0049150 [Sarcoptes scabiei]
MINNIVDHYTGTGCVHGLGTLGSNFIRICGILVGAAGDVELGLVDNETELCEEVDFDISK